MKEWTKECIEEIETLFKTQQEEVASRRVRLPIMVADGNEWFGGDTLEERLRNNTLGDYIEYTGESAETTIWYDENNIKAFHPAWTGMSPPLGEPRTPDVVWKAGTWLVRLALAKAIQGGDVLPRGQEELRPVFEEKCKSRLEKATD